MNPPPPLGMHQATTSKWQRQKHQSWNFSVRRDFLNLPTSSSYAIQYIEGITLEELESLWNALLAKTMAGDSNQNSSGYMLTDCSQGHEVFWFGRK